MSVLAQGVLARIVAIGLLVVSASMAAGADAAPLPVRSSVVTSPDGVALAVQEYGDADGAPVILVHGLLGSHLSWRAQVESQVLGHRRLITYDLRGHGSSGAPTAAEMYVDGRRWAEDLATVIRASGARRPVLVGWSLGAAVISNYLAIHGDADIAGVVYVGGVVELDPSQIVAHPEVYRDLAATDLLTHLEAERAFLALCFHRPPTPETFQLLLANAALASPHMQRAVHRMTVDAAKGLGRVSRPMLQIYGARDALVRAEPSADRARTLNKAIRTSVYEDVGHAPFIEAATRFNEELDRFVEASWRAD